MNAIFQVGARLDVAKTLGVYEKETGATLLVPGVQAGVPGIQEGLTAEGTLLTPQILKDGADSVGLAGALSRVFINIGEYHEEWVKHFKPVIGGTETPMDVASANKGSPYWNATAERLPSLAAFFLKTAAPIHLEDAPEGKAYLDPSDAIEKGKLVFADNCAPCHSSKQPPGAPSNPGYFDENLRRWVQSAPYKQWMRAEVTKPDFRDKNLFSTDTRYSIKLVGTNCVRVRGLPELVFELGLSRSLGGVHGSGWRGHEMNVSRPRLPVTKPASRLEVEVPHCEIPRSPWRTRARHPMPRRSAPRGPTSDRSAPAERCGASRRSGDAWALPLLNLSDGIIASTFDSRVLVTTNARHTEIDPAILRPGRLCRHVAVPPLHADHATGLLRNLLAAEPRAPFRKPVTLAEVYAAAHGERERHA